MRFSFSLLFALGLAAMVSCSENSQDLSSADDEKMYTHSYLVAPRPAVEGTADDPFANHDRRTAQEKFEDAGITFPEGSGFYTVSFSGFTVRNTKKNIQRIEAWLDREIGPDNWKPYTEDAVGTVLPPSNDQSQP